MPQTRNSIHAIQTVRLCRWIGSGAGLRIGQVCGARPGTAMTLLAGLLSVGFLASRREAG